MEITSIIIITLLVAGVSYILIKALFKYLTESLEREQRRFLKEHEDVSFETSEGTFHMFHDSSLPETDQSIILIQKSPKENGYVVTVSDPEKIINSALCQHHWSDWKVLNNLHNGNDVWGRECAFCDKEDRIVSKLTPKD